jgi:hypothetical protein
VDVTSEEVGVWIGIVMYMGVHHSPAIADYSKHIELSSVQKEQKDHSTGKGIRFCHSKVDLILNLSAHLVAYMFFWAFHSMIINSHVHGTSGHTIKSTTCSRTVNSGGSERLSSSRDATDMLAM